MGDTTTTTTVADLAAAWVATRGYATTSARQRGYILDRFCRAVPPEPSAIGVLCLVAWWDGLRDLAPASKRAHYSAVCCFCDWARAAGYDVPDLRAVVRRPTVPRTPPKVLTPAEVARLRSAPMTWADRLTVALMLDLGFRAAEVSKLRGEHLDHDAMTIIVSGKGGHRDVLPLVTSVAEMVPAHTVGRLVACAPNHVSSRMTALLESVGIEDRTGHALRRTFATELMRRGVDLRTVQSLLRHQSLATSEAYLARPELERMRAAVAA